MIDHNEHVYKYLESLRDEANLKKTSFTRMAEIIRTIGRYVAGV